MSVYCTLFDSNYLDKGLALWESLCAYEQGFKLYIFAFDDRCADILEQESLRGVTVVRLEEFETQELLMVKKKRSSAEYCWTCTPWIIKHVLEQFREPICTYIDADMMFFSSASYVFENMKSLGCSTVIVPHRLPANKKNQEEHVGAYCVEFNTFVNDAAGRAVLDWWAEACLEWCYYTPRGSVETRYGDQKYLEEFPKRFSSVYICEDAGVGIAPWNAAQLRLARDCSNQVEVMATGEKFPIVICHFAGITHLTRKIVNVASGIKDRELHRVLYDVYMETIKRYRKYLLDKYNLELYVRRKVTNNPLLGLFQRFIQPILHIRQANDIYRL